MKKVKQGFRIDFRHPAAIVSMLAFALSIPMQIMGYADRLREPVIAIAVVFLPVLCAVLMIVMTLTFGRNALWVSIFPVFLGVLGLAFKLKIDPRESSQLHHIAAAVLYGAIVALWALTVLYVIRTKWVLVILFILPFLKHLFINDFPVLFGKADPVPASTWMKEICLLSLMLALSASALAFEKKTVPDSALRE